MTESALSLWFLGMIAVCALTMTIALLMTIRELLRTMRQLRAMLPRCDRAVLEAHRTLAQARQFLTRTNHASRHVETVVHQACNAASGVMEQIGHLRDRTQAFFSARIGNGTRSGPRRRSEGGS